MSDPPLCHGPSSRASRSLTTCYADASETMRDTTIRSIGLVAMNYKFDGSSEAENFKKSIVFASASTVIRAYNPGVLKLGTERKFAR